jgi:3-oxo-5alpha-steroid 4-dehydrogenase
VLQPWLDARAPGYPARMPDSVRDPRGIERFDDEVDVLVVGLGAAGAAAALEAAGAGAETLVMERAGAGGGTSAMSGGVLYLGGGTALQKACGFDDAPEEMFKYLMASSGESPDEDKMRLYCEGSVEHYEWLVARGVPFKPVFYPGISGEPPTDDGLVWSGSEQVHPFADLAVPAPRGHVVRNPYQAGPVLMQKLCAAVEASPARIAPNHRCVALLQEPDGSVVGAVAQSFGEERALRARRGVILTTGGFINNEEMILAHQPLTHRCMFRVGAEGDDGSGIRLGIAAGAATMHMDAASISLPVTQPWGLKRGILVNAQGQRFINEDAYYGRLGEWALFHHGGRAWLIVDDEVFEKPDYPPREVVAVGETPREIEEGLSLPPGSLESTLALYNRHAERGEDPVFHKVPRYVKPLTRPPYGAFDCTTETSLYAAFTLGGLRSDPDGRILDPEGRPIPGLFGGGRSTSGLSVGSYSSGLSLGDGTFFGRRAGRCAAGS